jgi:hypothetical protein
MTRKITRIEEKGEDVIGGQTSGEGQTNKTNRIK